MSSSHPHLTVRTVSTTAEFCTLESGWNQLLRSTAADTLFLTWEWVSTWWRIYGGDSDLHVLTARDESGALVGLAPLKSVSRRVLGLWKLETLEFIGCGKDVTPEYLDVIVRPGYERVVLAAFAEHLQKRATPPALDLRPVRAESPTLEFLTRALAQPGSDMRRTRDAVCPIALLPTTAEAFLDARSRNYRKKMREYERRCERDLSAEVRVSATPSELERDMTALISLHRQRWGRESRAFQTHEYGQFHHELAQRLFGNGWVRLFSLNARGKPIALLYCFSYGNRYYYYQGGWDPALAKYRLGLVLMHKAVQHAISEGATVFDFLRGEESYKDRWATDRLTSERLMFWPGTAIRAASHAQDMVSRVIHHGRRAASAVLPQSRVSNNS